MTRRRLAPEEKAHRLDIHVYQKHFKIIDLAIEKLALENPSDVARRALEHYGSQHLAEDLELDALAEAEKNLESFKDRHDGKTPLQVRAEEMAKAGKLKAEKLEIDNKTLDKMYEKLKSSKGRGTFNIRNFVEANIQKGQYKFDRLTVDEVVEDLTRRSKDNEEEQVP